MKLIQFVENENWNFLKFIWTNKFTNVSYIFRTIESQVIVRLRIFTRLQKIEKSEKEILFFVLVLFTSLFNFRQMMSIKNELELDEHWFGV